MVSHWNAPTLKPNVAFWSMCMRYVHAGCKVLLWIIAFHWQRPLPQYCQALWPSTPWPHTAVRHPLWCHSSVTPFLYTSHVLHTRACSLKASFFSSWCYTFPLRQSTINCCGSPAAADILSVHAAMRLYSQQMGKSSVSRNPQGQKRGNTFSAGNWEIVLSGGVSYYLQTSVMPFLLIQGPHSTWWLDLKFNKNTDRQAVTIQPTALFSPRSSVLIGLNL